MVQLINPWTGEYVMDITWAEVVRWARGHVHQNDRRGWIIEAREAFDSGDSEKLSSMILGS